MQDKITLTPEQLAAWKNDAARKEWLAAHRTWPRIDTAPAIGLEWFCYELPDGMRIIAMSQPCSYATKGHSQRYSWWYKGNKYPNVMCAVSVSEICDRLKDLKTKAAKGGTA